MSRSFLLFVCFIAAAAALSTGSAVQRGHKIAARANRLDVLLRRPARTAEEDKELIGLAAQDTYDEGSFTPSHAAFKAAHNDVFVDLLRHCDYSGTAFYLDGPAGKSTAALAAAGVDRSRCFTANWHADTSAALREFLPHENVAESRAEDALRENFNGVAFSTVYLDGCGGQTEPLIASVDALLDGETSQQMDRVAIGFTLTEAEPTGRSLFDREADVHRGILRAAKRAGYDRMAHCFDEPEEYGIRDVETLKRCEGTITSWVVLQRAKGNARTTGRNARGVRMSLANGPAAESSSSSSDAPPRLGNGIEDQIMAWMASEEGQSALQDEDDEEMEEEDSDAFVNADAPSHARPLPAEESLREEDVFEARGLREEAYLGKGSEMRLLEDTGKAAAAVRKHGVVRLGGVLTEDTAVELRDYIIDELHRIIDGGKAGKADGYELVHVGSGTQRLSKHATGEEGDAEETRWDLRLSQEVPIVKKALDELLHGTNSNSRSPLANAITALGGVDAELWELAAIISAPGAPPQIVHADATWTADPLLLTAFVALQEVTREMGPTRFLPRTHSDPKHARIVARSDATNLMVHTHKRGEGKPPPSWVGLLKRGEAAFYDGRLLHSGGANRSDKERVLLYVTYRARR